MFNELFRFTRKLWGPEQLHSVIDLVKSAGGQAIEVDHGLVISAHARYIDAQVFEIIFLHGEAGEIGGIITHLNALIVSDACGGRSAHIKSLSRRNDLGETTCTYTIRDT